MGPCFSYHMVPFVMVAQLFASSPSSWMRCGLRVLKENDQTHLCLVGALGPGVPHVINTKLLKHFTCLTYNNGRSAGSSSGLLPVMEKAGGGEWAVGAWIEFHVQCHLEGSWGQVSLGNTI